MHFLLAHVYCVLGSHGLILVPQSVWLFSSLPSPQLSMPSQIWKRGMHRLLSHWNFLVRSHVNAEQSDGASSELSIIEF